MEYFPPALEALVEQFARLPGIGRKTAQRLAFFVLSLPEEEVEAFAQSVRNAKHTIALCPVCQPLFASATAWSTVGMLPIQFFTVDQPDFRSPTPCFTAGMLPIQFFTEDQPSFTSFTPVSRDKPSFVLSAHQSFTLSHHSEALFFTSARN